MFRTCIISFVVIATTIGCAAKRVSRVDPDARAAIGYAATAKYPGNARTATQQVVTAAVDYPRARQIEILNLSDNAVTNPALWVNGAFVRELPTLPPRGTHVVRYQALLQAGQTANDLGRAAQTVTKVEIETNGQLYNVLGPARK